MIEFKLMLPPAVKKYFWEVDTRDLDPRKYPEYVIARILEYGDDKAIRWLFKNFDKNKVKRALEKRRGFSKKSANYWSLILNIPKNRIRCLRKQSQKTLARTWPH